MDWLDERASVRAVWRWIADEEIPGGARLRYVFGSVLLYLFAQQVVLGILLASYYAPSATDAWASVAYLNDRVTGGWFLRGLHYHGSSVMVVYAIPSPNGRAPGSTSENCAAAAERGSRARSRNSARTRRKYSRSVVTGIFQAITRFFTPA